MVIFTIENSHLFIFIRGEPSFGQHLVHFLLKSFLNVLVFGQIIDDPFEGDCGCIAPRPKQVTDAHYQIFDLNEKEVTKVRKG